mgnify:CR=1 FL=1
MSQVPQMICIDPAEAGGPDVLCAVERPIPQPGAGEVLIRVAAAGSPAANPAFDVTPARLVTGLITERGRVAANEAALAALYPEKLAL